MKGKIIGRCGAQRYYIDGKEVTREEFDAAFPPQKDHGVGAGLIGWKPIHSDALAVHPLQIPEAMESATKRGVPTDFLPDGRPVLTSRSHRRAYLKAYGFHDNQGGYGDG